MTKRAYSIEEVELQDWEKPIRIHTLVLKKFRVLIDIVGKLNPTEEEKAKKTYKEVSYLDVMLEATAFCMQTFEPALADVEKLEEHIDLPTMEHILEIVAGVKLNDPNP